MTARRTSPGHGVSPEEVEQATECPFSTMPGRDGTTSLFGQAHSGRYLLAVLAESGDGRWHVMTARSMTEAERRVFKKKTKRP
jgi:hypothetical protein